MKYIVETKGLSKSDGDKQVVRDVDLKVPKGCVYGFMGPNGAGKSTTLKMLLGLVKAGSGEARIAGKEMNPKNRLEILKETGSLIESPSYYGHLTGRENLEIVRTLKGAPEKEIDQVLKLVRMERQQNKKAREYSLGMKQRLGLAGGGPAGGAGGWRWWPGPNAGLGPQPSAPPRPWKMPTSSTASTAVPTG